MGVRQCLRHGSACIVTAVLVVVVFDGSGGLGVQRAIQATLLSNSEFGRCNAMQNTEGGCHVNAHLDGGSQGPLGSIDCSLQHLHRLASCFAAPGLHVCCLPVFISHARDCIVKRDATAYRFSSTACRSE